MKNYMENYKIKNNENYEEWENQLPDYVHVYLEYTSGNIICRSLGGATALETLFATKEDIENAETYADTYSNIRVIYNKSTGCYYILH